MIKILMIDDDTSFLNIYRRILEHSGYGVSTATDGIFALELLTQMEVDLAILDVAMPKINGIEVLKKIKEDYPDVQVIMLTGEGSVEGAVEAVKQGAFTYMMKPVDIEQLLLNINKAEEFCLLNRENKQLRSQLANSEKQMDFIGDSKSMDLLKKEIEQVAPTDSTVLIQGESGTGKEIVANLIHAKSRRNTGPLIKVNCAALAESILESELFGHERGAFTGAISSKKGRFELAQGGTLFLDEIGELSLSLQSKLLRVLQEREFERVGGMETIQVDFRLICATNRALKEEIAQEKFREDLYFRINVVPFTILPLRERQEDILPIMKYYLDYYALEMKKPKITVSTSVAEALLQYEWRGNVREIRNMAERIMVFSKGAPLSLNMLPEEVRKPEAGEVEIEHQMDFREAKQSFEKNYITQRLERNHWNISSTAIEIGIARKNLQLKIKQLEIERGDTKK